MEDTKRIHGNPPVRVGEEREGLVDSIGNKGDGIVRIDGFVIMIPHCNQGETVRFKVTRVLEKMGFGVRL